MFEWLSTYDKILVTGPQRSGTRISAKMIAHDTGHAFIDEDDIGLDSLYKLYAIMEGKHGIVVQCPALCRHIHLLDGDDIAIVLMKRNVDDIMKSQQRIGWWGERLELARYDRSDGVIAEIKYQYWDKCQKGQIKHAFEIEYAGLASHPLWVSQEERQHFNARQTVDSRHTIMPNQKAQFLPYSDIYFIDRLGTESAILVRTKEYARVLNNTGRFVWGLCDGAHTRQDIIRALQDEYADESIDILEADLDSFLSELIANGFLRLDVSGAGFRNAKAG